MRPIHLLSHFLSLSSYLAYIVWKNTQGTVEFSDFMIGAGLMIVVQVAVEAADFH